MTSSTYLNPTQVFLKMTRDVIWLCLKVDLQVFWTSIQDCTQKIVEYDVPFCISLFLLGDPSTLKEVNLSISKELVQTTVILGRRLLVQQWKLAHAPSVTEWYYLLAKVAAYERISFSLLCMMEGYYFKWERFLQHITVRAEALPTFIV